jgi:chaperone required for assembly of F1-ATPase
MAKAIADEWQAQEKIINPLTMPCTKTANAALDKVAIQHAEVADMLAAYGDCDLLCYRADSPQELIDRQNAFWDPMLAWAQDALGVRLLPRTGIMHVPQSAEAVASLTDRTHALDDFELAAFHDLVSLSGSLVLAYAATMNARDMDSLWDMSRLDELWQSELWGAADDAEALAAAKKGSFLHAKLMFDLSKEA